MIREWHKVKMKNPKATLKQKVMIAPKTAAPKTANVNLTQIHKLC